MPDVLSKEFLAILARLGTAEAQSEGLFACLAKAQCIDIATELQQASSKIIATIDGGTCSDQSLQEEVAAMDRLLDKLRCYCTQRSIGNWLFEMIWREDGTGSSDFWAHLYYITDDPSPFQDTIAMSMIAIRSAAARALQYYERNDCKRHE